MKIVVISDTHNHHDAIHMPDGDILIHCGDITMNGTTDEIQSFNRYLGQLPYRTKIVISGNHDSCLQHEKNKSRKLLSNATYLQDDYLELDGLRIYGTPWQPTYDNMAFNLPDGALTSIWDKIPDKIDLLVTHTPPFEILDINQGGLHCGSHSLRNRLKRMMGLKYHFFGHIHQSHGVYVSNGLTYANASICGGDYKPKFQPIVVTL